MSIGEMLINVCGSYSENQAFKGKTTFLKGNMSTKTQLTSMKALHLANY